MKWMMYFGTGLALLSIITCITVSALLVLMIALLIGYWTLLISFPVFCWLLADALKDCAKLAGYLMEYEP